MGKKNKATGLGKSIIRDRFGKQNRDRAGVDTFLHTSDLNDGYDWGRLNLQSVTEQNNLEDFLSTAELAGTEFTAEKMNVTVIQNDVHGGLPHGEELTRIRNLHTQHRDLIRIPRRPHWNKEMSATDLDQNEKAAFLEWRRSLALLQEVDGIVLTPYEKNLDFWRQLWRVIERSDVVVQIVDARNPLLFFCPDLETYVREVDPSKQCVVLINKADFLSQSQRDAWAEYFNKLKVRIAFWSAKEETKRQEEADKLEAENDELDEFTDTVTDLTDHTSDEDSDNDNVLDIDEDKDEENLEGISDKVEVLDKKKGVVDPADRFSESNTAVTDSAISGETRGTSGVDSDKEVNTGERNKEKGVKRKVDQEIGNVARDKTDVVDGETGVDVSVDKEVTNSVDKIHINEMDTDTAENVQETDKDSSRSAHRRTGYFTDNTGCLYTGPELMEYLRSFHQDTNMTTIGMVGYPNVGKSSTINAILKMKKVPVSATPGRTKHFQTLFVEKDLMLCDCPGLVFPSFVTTKAELVVSGILPIDQMRDHVPPTALICSVIPRKHLESLYGIIIAKPREGEDPYRVPTAEEFLNAYGAMRGFMTSRGQPDCPRSSRYVLKHYVNGKLLYCVPPPGVSAEDFNVFSDTVAGPLTEPMTCQLVPESSAIDKDFFQKEFPTSHQRTARSGSKDVKTDGVTDKPWKKHNNRKKKEKLRRVYGYLDKQ